MVATIVDAWTRNAFSEGARGVAITIARACVTCVRAMLVRAAVDVHEASSGTLGAVALVSRRVATILPCLTSKACDARSAPWCRIVLPMCTLLAVTAVGFTKSISGAKEALRTLHARCALTRILILAFCALYARRHLRGRLVLPHMACCA